MSKSSLNFLWNTVIFVTCVTLFSTISRANDISLVLKGGDFKVRGKLVKFTGTYYVVESQELGTITVDAKKFKCTSPNCPTQASNAPTKNTIKTPVTNNFGIHGSNTIGAKLMPALIASHAKYIGLKSKKIIGSRTEEINLLINRKDGTNYSNIALHSHGSGTSFPGLVSGMAQIGMSSRPIKPKEQEAMANAGIKGIKSFKHEHILALDGLIMIVSKSNPINSLSMQQIAQVFSGQISDWSQLGRKKPGPINIYARDVKSGTFDTFNSLVLKAHKVKVISSANRLESNDELSDKVASDPDGIGFTGFASQRNSKPIAISSACGIISKPTAFNVKTEDYPLARRLYLYTTKNLNSPHAKKLLNYSLSNRAQKVITKVGFINQLIDMKPFDEQVNRLATALTVPNEETDISLIQSFAKEFIGSQRLSVTFRFKQNSIQLNTKSATDIKRLAQLIQSKALKDQEIYLIGFSSAGGPFQLNRELAFKRALRIKSALISESAGRITDEKLKIRSYGELFPVSCNTNETSSRKNQRVEVWVK